MDAIDRDIYRLMMQDFAYWLAAVPWRSYADRVFVQLDKALVQTKYFPCEWAAGLFFLGCLVVYVKHGLRVDNQSAVSLICILGIGCILSALSFYVRKNRMRQVQALSSLIGSAFMMLQLQFY